jgi:AraC family transcriptional activator of tynA and feaB
MKAFSTEPIASLKQLQAWQEIMSDVYYSVEIKRNSGRSLRGQIKEYDVGSVSITTFDSDEQRVFRTRQRIACDPDDSYVLVMPARKHLYYSQGGRSGVVPPGGYVLVNASEFYELSCPDGFFNWTIKIPGTDMRDRVPNVDDHCACRLPNSLAMARVARQLVRSVAVTFAQEQLSNESALANNLIDFIALLVLSETQDANGSARRSSFRLRQRIFNYIQRNLTDPGLNPTKIAEESGISLSYLYKLFSDSQVTIGQMIQAQRLRWAYERLIADRKGQITVAEIAYAAGFRNVSHFSKVFSQKFGLSPREVRQQNPALDG